MEGNKIEIVGSGRIDELWLNGLFYCEWLVVFYFSFIKDDRINKLDGNSVHCFESVF